jgi:hypothetical protein
VTDGSVSARYVITLDDVVDINRLLTRSLNRSLTTGIALLCGVGAVAAIIVGSVPTALALVLIAVLMALSGRASGLERWSVARQAREIVGVPCTVSVDHEGVGFQQGGVTARFAYSELTRFERDECAFLMLGRNHSRIGVPRRALTAAEADTFATLVREGAAARAGSGDSPRPASKAGA